MTSTNFGILGGIEIPNYATRCFDDTETHSKLKGFITTYFGNTDVYRETTQHFLKDRDYVDYSRFLSKTPFEGHPSKETADKTHFSFLKQVYCAYDDLPSLDDVPAKYKRLLNTPGDEINCGTHAIGMFGDDFENLSSISLETLGEVLMDCGMDEIVDAFFERVSEPREGNLVIYRDWGRRHFEVVHAGIYKEAPYGTVESKFAPHGPVLQHELFFLPESWGLTAEFYQLKTSIET